MQSYFVVTRLAQRKGLSQVRVGEVIRNPPTKQSGGYAGQVGKPALQF